MCPHNCMETGMDVDKIFFHWVCDVTPQYQSGLSILAKKSLKCSENVNLNIYNSMTNGHTPSAEKDCVISSKAPEKLPNGCCYEIVYIKSTYVQYIVIQ